MELVNNPQNYDGKLPTNIRLVEQLKTLALAEAESRGTTLAQVVNEALAKHYNVQLEGERTDVSINTQSRMG